MKRLLALIITILLIFSITACTAPNDGVEQTEENEPGIQDGHIYLYGEQLHGDRDYYDEELRIWGEFYEKGYRHLFEERSYFAAAYLNEWMADDSDKILLELYSDWEGTNAHDSSTLEYYRYIKENYPETIFHGTDIGHQYDSTGKRYLKKLEDEGRISSDDYAIAKDNYEQGEKYYLDQAGKPAKGYRERCMAENIIREYEKIQGETVMGIYGSAHVLLGKRPWSNVDTMAQTVADRFGDILHTDMIVLSSIIRTDIITVNGKDYEAVYYGEDVWQGTKYEYWRLENAFEDFKDYPLTDNYLPYYNYPMKVEEQQIYVIDVTNTDGSFERWYYRSDNYVEDGYLTTLEFKVDE